MVLREKSSRRNGTERGGEQAGQGGGRRTGEGNLEEEDQGFGVDMHGAAVKDDLQRRPDLRTRQVPRMGGAGGKGASRGEEGGRLGEHRGEEGGGSGRVEERKGGEEGGEGERRPGGHQPLESSRTFQQLKSVRMSWAAPPVEVLEVPTASGGGGRGGASPCI